MFFLSKRQKRQLAIIKRLRDNEGEFYPVSDLAALFNMTPNNMNKFLQKIGILERYKINFKRPISKVKHPNRYGWKIAKEYRHLIEEGMVSENVGPYKHSVFWNLDSSTIEFVQDLMFKKFKHKERY